MGPKAVKKEVFVCGCRNVLHDVDTRWLYVKWRDGGGLPSEQSVLAIGCDTLDKSVAEIG